MKISSIANYIMNLFGIKQNNRKNLSIDDIIALDYYECICYLYKGNKKPVVLGFEDDVNIWLKTSVGAIDIDAIPHNEGHLTNNVNELEVLIGEQNYDNEYVINLINKKIDSSWKNK